MRLILLFVLSALSACTIIPGSTISHQDFPSELYDVPDKLFGGQDIVEPNVVLITPRLMRELAASQPPRVIPEFFLDRSSFDKDYRYRVGPGDVLTVTVWDHPELTIPSGQFRDAKDQGNIVHEDGTIFYPYVGKIVAAGKTPAELRDELAKKLGQYIEEPQVDVKVAVFNSQKFYLTGSVNAPGTYAITHIPLRLLEAINLAGGFKGEADIYGATLTRGDQNIEVPIYDILYEGDLRANIVMEHGDVLHIAPDETRRVFVMGEVVRPQSVRMTQKPMTLTQILSQVGGIREDRADGRGIYVVRQSDVPEIVNVFQLDARQAYALSLADDFILNSRDIVYVSPSPISRWNRLITNLLPAIQGLNDLDSIQTRN